MQEKFEQTRCASHPDSDSRSPFSLKLKRFADKQAELARDQLKMSHEQLRLTHLMLEYIDVAQQCAPPTPASPAPRTTATTEDDEDSSNEDTQHALLTKKIQILNSIISDLNASHVRQLTRARTSYTFLLFVFLLGFFAGVIYQDRSL